MLTALALALVVEANFAPSLRPTRQMSFKLGSAA